MNRRQCLLSLLGVPFAGLMIPFVLKAKPVLYKIPCGLMTRETPEFSVYMSSSAVGKRVFIDGREVAEGMAEYLAASRRRVVLDEIHRHKSRGVYDVLVQKRRSLSGVKRG